MASKTFKIGEYCKGGIITVEVSKTKVAVIGKEWDNSAGYSRASNQSNAKEFTRIEVDPRLNDSRLKLDMFISDLTSHYYTEQVLEYIESKVELAKQGWY